MVISPYTIEKQCASIATDTRLQLKLTPVSIFKWSDGVITLLMRKASIQLHANL